jgi:hypothetical protein
MGQQRRLGRWQNEKHFLWATHSFRCRGGVLKCETGIDAIDDGSPLGSELARSGMLGFVWWHSLAWVNMG